ncbi:hypothetical protein J2Y55_003828 [Bosea sp. BE125]|uniref:hypothetical protein n=1 Tax=Bosea sp. BE125 TaxID=2817909 RepID=UPI002866BE44|nr:hypothetical protein [Bosea sp. BE125]MDR6872809.1 hypothetical protein [Bosea sp. BE125]
MLALLEGGTYFHKEAIEGERLTGRFDRTIYAQELDAAALVGCDALIVADRIHPAVLRRKRPLLLSYLATGGTLIVLGENRAQDWAPGVAWEFRPTNFWWWLEKGTDPGHRIVAPGHEIFRHVGMGELVWHYHGLLTPPPGATSLVEITPEGDPHGKGGSILYDHRNVGGGPGRMIVTTLDPFYHHGSFFMPAASRFLGKLLDWTDEAFRASR